VLLKIGPSLTNTAATTLDMDGIGAVAIEYPDGSELRGAELVTGSYADLIYSGTNWILLASIPADPETAAPPGVVAVVPPVTANDTALIDFTAHIDDTFNHYIFDFYNVVPVTGANALLLRFSTDAGATFVATSTYYNAYALAVYPVLTGAFGGSIGTYVNCSTLISGTPPSVCSGTVDLYHPSGTGRLKHVIVRCAHWNSTDGAFRMFHNGGILNTTSAINGIRFMMLNGNISTGSFHMYGMRA
jgi:hypothetical protein